LLLQVLLRASLAAARLHHGYITTLHILLGLVSAAAAAAAADSSSSSSSSEHPLAAAADKYVEAEAAVAALIDGPSCSSTYAVRSAVGAAHTLLGQSRGLAVINWCGQLSTPAVKVLQAADQMRVDCGEARGSCRGLTGPAYRCLQDLAATRVCLVNSDDTFIMYHDDHKAKLPRFFGLLLPPSLLCQVMS
jgi:hypothetical protein